MHELASFFGYQFSVLCFQFKVCQLSVNQLYLKYMIRDVTDLEIYNLSLESLESVYKLANSLPLQHRKLKYQLIESAEKIAPQIAEGFGKKRAPKEFCRFLSMALGSSDEVITHLRETKIVAKTYRRIDVNLCDVLIDRYKLLSKKINRLLTSWQKFA